MKRWPTSGWTHAGIALASAPIVTAVAAYMAYGSALDYINRTGTHPGDSGWNGLGASFAAFGVAFWTFPIAFIVIFVIQRIYASKGDDDDLIDENRAGGE